MSTLLRRPGRSLDQGTNGDKTEGAGRGGLGRRRYFGDFGTGLSPGAEKGELGERLGLQRCGGEEGAAGSGRDPEGGTAGTHSPAQVKGNARWRDPHAP